MMIVIMRFFFLYVWSHVKMAQQEKKSWQKAQANSLFWNWQAEIPDMQLRLTGMVTYREKWWREDSLSPIYVQCKNIVNQSFAVKNIGLSCQSEGWGLKTPQSGPLFVQYFWQFKEKPYGQAFSGTFVQRLYNSYHHAHMPGEHSWQSPGPGP